MAKIRIIEVGMRDGLQNEAVHLSQSQRYQFAKRLAECGHTYIEAGAFVSPEWVPQMAGSKNLLTKILKSQKQKIISSKVKITALVPNIYGLSQAIDTGLKEVAIFGAASETFSKKNINCSVKESLKRFKEVCAAAKKNKIKVRAYVSTAFGCPYEGKISKIKVLKMINALLEMGVYEVSIGDTIGVATPKQVKDLLKDIKYARKIPEVAMHFHDTRGTALANISTSLEYGVTAFDTSIGGLGGCPYAPGAAGNVATEDVVYMLHGMGLKTGLDLDKLVKTTHWMTKQLGRTLPSKLSLTGADSLY